MRACALNTGPRPVGWPTKYNTSREYVGRAYPCSRAVNRPAPAGPGRILGGVMVTGRLLGVVVLASAIIAQMGHSRADDVQWDIYKRQSEDQARALAQCAYGSGGRYDANAARCMALRGYATPPAYAPNGGTDLPNGNYVPPGYVCIRNCQ
jgi:hypothetical protein